MEQTYTSIIIRKRDVGEMDRLYSLLTLERGKMQVLAKSVRKHGAKLAGFLENFTLADVTIARSRGTGKITGSIVENNFTNLKKDYDAMESIFSTMKILNRFTDLENEDPKLFQLTKQYLEVMDNIAKNFSDADVEDKKNRMLLVGAGFLTKMADVLGYAIEAHNCAYCQSPVGKDDNAFDAQSGGVICKNCLSQSRSLVHISRNGIKILRIFMGNSLASLVKLKVERRDVACVNGVLNEFYRWIA